MFSGFQIQLLSPSLTAVILTTIFSCVSFQGAVAQAATLPENTILLDFHGNTCPPCQAMRPVIAQLKQAGYPVRSINVDQEPLMADRFGVQRIPCFIMISAGKIAARTEGLTSLERLSRMCRDGINDALRTRQVAEAEYRVGASNQARESLAAFTGKTRTEAIRRQFVRPTSQPAVQSIPLPSVAEETLVRNPVGASSSFGPRGQEVAMANSNGRNLDSNEDQLAPERLLASSVRIRVRTATTLSSGSGTLVDCRQNRALILTCGHIFRDYQKEKGGLIEIDMFGSRPLQNIPGTYIYHDIDSDLGLISIPVSYPVHTIPVAPPSYRVVRGAAAASSGCDNGRVPTVKPCQITTINRFQGAANIQATGGPIEGRSGGGLFSKDGYLIGVTSASIPGENQGLYSFFPAIHDLLTKRNLNEIYSQPLNESLQLASSSRAQMPREMPTRPTMIQWTDMPMSVNGQSETSASRPPLSSLEEKPGSAMTASYPASPAAADSPSANSAAASAIDYSRIPGYGSNAPIRAPVNGPIASNASLTNAPTASADARSAQVQPPRPQWPPAW